MKPKKGYDHIYEKVTQSELCQFISQYKAEHDIKHLCHILNDLRNNYSQSKSQTDSK